MKDKEIEYRLLYKIETPTNDVIQLGDCFYSPKAYAICRYYEQWRKCFNNKKMYDLHFFVNGKDKTKKINKLLDLYKL